VGFEQNLRVYLESRQRASTGEPRLRHVDEYELYRHLLERLRALEHAGEAKAVQRLFDEWPLTRLATFAQFLEAFPQQLAPTEPQAAVAFACRALDVAIGRLDPEVSLVERLDMERIVRLFDRFDAAHAQLPRYALENHLVRRSPPHPARPAEPTLTELGRIFLQLRGKNGVRWLMTCEVVQNTGPSDPWHVPQALLQEVMTAYGITPYFIDDKGDFEYSEDTRNRLVSLGVLSAVVDRPGGVVLEYRVEPSMRDVVQAVLNIGPWHTAVRALLEDERASVLPGSSATTSEATIEQTKLIVHEVRNALIPVRHDIEALRAFAAEHAQQERIDAAKQGVARVLDFVEAMAQMSEVITEPAARYEIGELVDEAVGWVDANRRVVRVASAQAAHVLAPRVRFARAISNVVGNALQVTTAKQPVRISITGGSGVVRVIVDDGGPGIPVEHRARVFLEGVTMRPDGMGSGFGLAFARRVVVDVLHGKIWCEDSDLGGARFVIEVPESSPE
jgi:signal transduction histidine kinase